MMFGYIGYIWAMIGCSAIVALFGASAGVLYFVARRREQQGGHAGVIVEQLGSPSDPVPGGEPPKPTSDAS